MQLHQLSQSNINRVLQRFLSYLTLWILVKPWKRSFREYLCIQPSKKQNWGIEDLRTVTSNSLLKGKRRVRGLEVSASTRCFRWEINQKTEKCRRVRPHTRPEDDTQRAIFTLQLNNSMISLKCFLTVSLRWVTYLKKKAAAVETQTQLRGKTRVVSSAEREPNTFLLFYFIFFFVLWCWPDWFLTHTFSTICSSADDKILWKITRLCSGFHCWTRTAFIKEHHKCFFFFFLYGRRPAASVV